MPVVCVLKNLGWAGGLIVPPLCACGLYFEKHGGAGGLIVPPLCACCLYFEKIGGAGGLIVPPLCSCGLYFEKIWWGRWFDCATSLCLWFVF